MGLKLSVQRRAASGLSLNANYTWSRCMGTKTPNTFAQIASGYTNPDDPEFDKGYCDHDRTHVGVSTSEWNRLTSAVALSVCSPPAGAPRAS